MAQAKGQSGKNNLKESPWDHSNLLSKYALYFMLPLFKRGEKLTLDDMGAPPRVDQSRLLGSRLEINYIQEQKSHSKPSFLRAILKTFGGQLLMLSILDLISKCIALPMQTIALGWLIRDAGLYLTFGTDSVAQQVLNNNNLTTTLPLVQPPEVMTEQVVGQPLTVNNLTASDDAYWRIIYDALYLMLFSILAMVLTHPFFFQTYHIGMKCRVAACNLIYKKALRLNQVAMSETTVGQMVNLLSNDVNRFDQVSQMLPYIFIAPIQAIIVLAILSIFYLGVLPTVASFLTILVYVIIQTSMGRGFSKFRARTAKRTDERVRLMNEIILAMRIIKMYTWEKPFKQLVYGARRREITTIGVASILRTINQTLFFVSSKTIVFVGLVTYVLLGNSFNPEIVFVSIGLANLVRISLTLFFPNAIAYCAETFISCRRINNFLMLPEIENWPVLYRASSDSFGCKHVVKMNKVYASWSTSDLSARGDSRWAIIRNMTLNIKPYDLVLVVGRVGSGKSSVLMAMLGELPITSGRVEMNGRISYASQEAWIFSGTVRENILFGKAMNSERYRRVLRVCCLERDLDILLAGDSTIVGERGVSLSGGQKARVNLARALYHEADIYLLDDPLSAVDAPVAKHIFNESMRTFLKKKTVILATHQLQFLMYASKVLVVDRDSPAAFGTLQEVMESAAFAEVNYSKEAFEEASATDATSKDTDAGEMETNRRRQIERQSRSQRRSKITDPTDPTVASGASTSSSGSQAKDNSESVERVSSRASSNLNESLKLIGPELSLSFKKTTTTKTNDVKEEEEAKASATNSSPATTSGGNSPDDDSTGMSLEQRLARKKLTTTSKGSDRRRGTETLSLISSDFSTYLYYVRNASGVLMFIWFLLINLLAQGLYQYTDFFLSYWTDSVQRQEYLGDAFQVETYVDSLSTKEITIVYTIIVALCFFTAFLRVATFFIGTLRASINIHDKLFNSVVHAPMTFFDFSPIGILLNRLSRDIGFVDETLPATAIEIVTIFINIGGIIAVTIIIDYKNIFTSILLFTIAFLLRRVCAKTITKLKQIEGVTRSPIFSHLSTTLSGLPTIRAFKVQEDFVRIFDKQQDSHSSAWFSYICAGRWLTVAMDWLCLTFIGLVVTILLAVSLDATNASLIGLLISQVVVLPGPFQWGMRQLIEVESQMTSVQRIKEFSELESEDKILKITGEGSWETEDLLLLHGSYQSGAILPAATLAQQRDGEIKFIQVSLRYFPDEPPVLKALDFIIRGREKVGIVGRTGAGKSSIVGALFRLYDFEGVIEIDGRDTKSLSLNELRRSMSIIPQDPILFAGTLRKNLDPFAEFSDTQLWDALEAVQLRPMFARYSQGLEFVINELGSNFSVGQRQLICLARAIVRRNRILILDEATANVDPETDIFIQRTIAQQFSHCTVLTIAHRLITIVDSDKVLVLDQGEVREFAEPYELLQDETSLFSQMVNSSAQQAPRLRKLIEDEHRKRLHETS